MFSFTAFKFSTFEGFKALKSFKAGDLVRKCAGLLGGSGGGRPDFASGAGKDASKIDVAVNEMKESL